MYTAAGGAKIVVPSQTSTATISYPFQKTPTGFTVTTTGEVQRFASGGTMTSDRNYTGTQTYSSVSLADGTYTVSGTLNVQDQVRRQRRPDEHGTDALRRLLQADRRDAVSHADGRQVARAAHVDLFRHVRVGDAGREDRHAAGLPVATIGWCRTRLTACAARLRDGCGSRFGS